MDLTGRVALITGAKRIGAVVAEALAARGMHVALSYARSEVEARSAAASVERLGTRAAVFEADLSHAPACHQLVESTVATLGRIDALVNMASVYTNRPLSSLTVADWDGVLGVDLRAAFLWLERGILARPEVEINK